MNVIDKIKIDIANSLTKGIALNRGSLAGYGSSSAQWLKMADNQSYLKTFTKNPVANAVINIKSDAKANMRFKIVDLNSDEIKPKDMNLQAKRMRSLLLNPNPLQSSFEFWKQFEVLKNTFGNSYIYPSYPAGFKKDLKDVTSMSNVWSQYMKPISTGFFFDAATINDMVKGWQFKYGTVTKMFDADEILHRNNVSIDLMEDGTILGTSRLKALAIPLSNIQLAFESRNVIINNRGFQGILTGAGKDANGTAPLLDSDKEEIQEQFEKYGLRKGQWQYIFAKNPINFIRTILPVKELQLFEEVATDTMHVAQGFGVPEILVKVYLSGATFENQEASERRLYQNTIIPEAEDDIAALNSFFKTESYGFRVEVSFEHIAVLQQNIKERSEVNRNNSAAYRLAFEKGAVTYNEWRNSIGLKPDTAMGEKTIFDLNDKELAILGITTNNGDNGTS